MYMLASTRLARWSLLGVLGAVLLLRGETWAASPAPLVDHHQHLFRREPPGPPVPGVEAADLIKLLDEAHIQRAVVLSVAYQFGNPNRPAVTKELDRVKAENDWTSQQVGRYPDRLLGFCGINPLKDYAIAELARCAKDPHLRSGIKLHFGNSDVDLDKPDHVARTRDVFRFANSNRMAIAVHMRPSVTSKRPYGAPQARRFLSELVSAAPDVPIQIAHLGGAGGYDDPGIDQTLTVFIEAVRQGDARMTRVYFDASGVAGFGQWEEKASVIATRIRQLGIHRVVYGSDGVIPGNSPAEAWAAFRRLPLTAAEFQVIQGNVAPYWR